MSALLLCLAAVAVWYFHYLWSRYPKGFPPHPAISIPFIGDVLNLGQGMTTGFGKFRQKYGDVFGFLLGQQR